MKKNFPSHLLDYALGVGKVATAKKDKVGVSPFFVALYFAEVVVVTSSFLMWTDALQCVSLIS